MANIVADLQSRGIRTDAVSQRMATEAVAAKQLLTLLKGSLRDTEAVERDRDAPAFSPETARR
jgi:hypothetical protein